MRLTVENFFSCLIFHPFKADDKKDMAIALVASIACAVFSIGICHAVCAIRNRFVHRPSDKATDRDRRMSELRDSALELSPTNQSLAAAQKPTEEGNKAPHTAITVTIPSEVKTTLDELFKDSPYSIDHLPIYPIIIDKKSQKPKRENMTAPVMKGITDDGRRFIAIKVDCDLKDEDIEKYGGSFEEEQNYYRDHRKLERVLILYQYHTDGALSGRGKGEYMWDQMRGARTIDPSFFTSNFTYAEDGSGPTDSQKENFALVQTLLKTGESPDANGLAWRIAT